MDVLLSPTTSLPKVTRLSQLHDGGHWHKKSNAWGETPTIDFAFSEPFRYVQLWTNVCLSFFPLPSHHDTQYTHIP